MHFPSKLSRRHAIRSARNHRKPELAFSCFFCVTKTLVHFQEFVELAGVNIFGSAFRLRKCRKCPRMSILGATPSQDTIPSLKESFKESSEKHPKIIKDNVSMKQKVTDTFQLCPWAASPLASSFATPPGKVTWRHGR